MPNEAHWQLQKQNAMRFKGAECQTLILVYNKSLLLATWTTCLGATDDEGAGREGSMPPH